MTITNVKSLLNNIYSSYTKHKHTSTHNIMFQTKEKGHNRLLGKKDVPKIQKNKN